jgi:hypothetical protein
MARRQVPAATIGGCAMMRWTFAGLATIALLAVAPGPLAADTGDYRLEAEMRFLGMSVGRVELEAAENGVTRDQRLAMATTGLVERLTGFRGELTARSRTDAAAPASLDFRSFTATDRATREVQLRYDGDGRVVELATFKRGEPRDTEVPAALRDGTIDPLTALAAVREWLPEVREKVPAATTLAIFDGRRRYDLHVRLVDRRVADFASGPTPILEIRLESEPLAGFDEDDDAGRPITVLMSDDDVLVPLIMRTEVMGDLTAALYTRRVCAEGPAQARCREYRY